jgi:hypothetical protein
VKHTDASLVEERLLGVIKRQPKRIYIGPVAELVKAYNKLHPEGPMLTRANVRPIIARLLREHPEITQTWRTGPLVMEATDD